jgi:hypothetical protein
MNTWQKLQSEMSQKNIVPACLPRASYADTKAGLMTQTGMRGCVKKEVA